LILVNLAYLAVALLAANAVLLLLIATLSVIQIVRGK
jgi:hypothetical protein